MELILSGELSPPKVGNISSYQGVAVPIPSLHNNVIVLLTSSPAPNQSATFDLRFLNDSQDVPKITVPPRCQFKEPQSEEDMESLGKKKFTSEMYKKICWVLQMYHT